MRAETHAATRKFPCKKQTRGSLRGAIQKGPFVLGSSVTLSAVDSTGTPTGHVFDTETGSDLGDFALTFAYRGNVDMQAQGYYYEEVTDVTDRAASPVRGDQRRAADRVHQHLDASRARRALAIVGDGGTTLAAAEAQAEAELIAALGIGGAGFSPGGLAIGFNVIQ
jgi:hypothetical protein